MTDVRQRMANAVLTKLRPKKQTDLVATDDKPKPRRYARSTRSIKVGAHLWPDVMELVKQHAEENQLTPSGAVHDCLRRYFNLPEIH